MSTKYSISNSDLGYIIINSIGVKLPPDKTKSVIIDEEQRNDPDVLSLERTGLVVIEKLAPVPVKKTSSPRKKGSPAKEPTQAQFGGRSIVVKGGKPQVAKSVKDIANTRFQAEAGSSTAVVMKDGKAVRTSTVRSISDAEPIEGGDEPEDFTPVQ